MMSDGERFGLAVAGGAVEQAQVAAQSIPDESKTDVISPASPPFVKTRKKGSIVKRPRKKYEPVFRVNILALIALVLGILSLTMVWVQEGSGSHPDNYGIGHYADDRDLRFGLGIGLFVAGTLLVMVIRLFGIAQLAGILLFFVALADDFSPHTLGHVLGVAHTGFYLGLVAGIFGTASIVMRYAVPVSERVLTFVPSRSGGATRVNVLSIAAGVLGIVCFFMPWVVGKVGWPYYSVMEWHYDYTLYTWISAIASSLFLFGSVANLVSPLGGFFQAAGVVFFFDDMLAEFRDFYDPYSHYGTIYVGFGLWVGVIASATAIISLFYTRRLLLPPSLFSFSRTRQASTAQAGMELLSPPAPAKGPAPWTLPRIVRTFTVLAIVFALTVLPLLVAFAAPITTLEVNVFNRNQDESAQVVIFVDGESEWSVSVPPASGISRSMRVSAGTHSVSLDYAIPGSPAGDVVDGQIDWSTYAKVKPFIGVTIGAYVGVYDWTTPYAYVTVESTSSGKTIVFDGIYQDYWGSPNPTDVSWSDIMLILGDGNGYVSWSNMTREEFYSFSYAGSTVPITWHYGSALSLGAVDIWLNITDLGANGNADAGDFISLETGNVSFDPALEYTLYVIHEPSDDLMCNAEF